MKNMTWFINKIAQQKSNASYSQKISTLFRKNWLLLLIICAGFILRFYNFPYRYNLSDEPIREAIIGLEGARTLQAPLVGGFSSAGPFTWGPWFYYHVIIASIFFPFSYTPWIVLSIASVASIVVLYKIGVELENKTLGYILAVLGTVSPALIIAGTHLTFPNLLSFYALLIMYMFIRSVKYSLSNIWYFGFGAVVGIAVNIHYQALALLPLLFILFIYLLFKRAALKPFLWWIVGFVGTFVQLLLFDMTNHWHNLTNILYYYLHGHDLIYVPNRWLFYVRDFWPAFWGDVLGLPVKIAAIGIIICAIYLSMRFIKKRDLSVALVFIGIIFTIEFILLRYYKGERFFGYFIFLRPFVFIFSGYVFYLLYRVAPKKVAPYFLAVVLFVYSSWIITSHIDQLKKDSFSMIVREQVHTLISTYPNKKFSLYICPSHANTYYTTMSRSILFLLDSEQKLDPDGVKVAVFSISCFDPSYEIPADISMDNLQSGCDFCLKRNQLIAGTELVDVSGASDEMLEQAKWSPLTFSIIYNSTAKWWYDEKP